jgi:hypothetical protein
MMTNPMAGQSWNLTQIRVSNHTTFNKGMTQAHTNIA